MSDYLDKEIENKKEENRYGIRLDLILTIAGFLAIVLWWMYGIYDRYLDCHCPNQCCEQQK